MDLRVLTLMLLGGLLGSPGLSAVSGPGDSLAVHTVRFYRAGQDRTRVQAFDDPAYLQSLLHPPGAYVEGHECSVVRDTIWIKFNSSC